MPEDAGLIVADAFGAEVVREAPEHRLSGATRRAVLLRFAHARRRPAACRDGSGQPPAGAEPAPRGNCVFVVKVVLAIQP